MTSERAFRFDLEAEASSFFDASSVPSDGKPRIVILMGGPASGKTTIRKRRYSTGYVLVDAAQIFLNLSQGELLPFPSAFERPMCAIGNLVAQRAILERRHIVTEIIGADAKPTEQLVEALRAAGYSVSLEHVECPIEEAQRRNLARGNDDVSCHYAEAYQRKWLIEAAHALLKNKKGRAAGSSPVANHEASGVSVIPDALQPKKLFDLINRADEYVALMRSGRNPGGVAAELKGYTRSYFQNVPMDQERLKTTGACIADLIYHYANSTTKMDSIIPIYLGDVLGYLFDSLRSRGVHLFYVLDNDFSTREDRFQITGYLFDFSGFKVVSPHRLWHGFARVETAQERKKRLTESSAPNFAQKAADGNVVSLEEIERVIRHGMASKSGVFYAEKNAEVNHLDHVVKVARQSDYTVIFRNEGATSKNFRLLQ